VKEGEDKRESTGTETWGMKARTRQHNTEHTADRERERGGGGREIVGGGLCIPRFASSQWLSVWHCDIIRVKQHWGR
jgi:hypothetical protein